MGITVFVNTDTTGAATQAGTGLISANGQPVTNVLVTGLAGNVASVTRLHPVGGVVAGAHAGTVSTSRTKTLTGIQASGSVGALSTGSNVTPWGFNISGMEWGGYSYGRAGASASPNRGFTPPRPELIHFLNNRGFKVTRLPIRWEMLQPVLTRQGAQSNVLSAFGISQSGQLRPAYVRMITDILDAHAANGMKCMIDLHNYCRYHDFIWNADGSVPGFTNPGGTQLPYSSTNSVQTRIFSSGPNPSLTQADFNDIWSRIVNQWKGHPGLGGYMIMNEPNEMDSNTTWPVYAQAVINRIRQLDPTTIIYVGGNNWSNSTTIGTNNPGYPLTGTNVVYEVHMYLDASSSGQWFDYDAEVAKGFSVGEAGPINANTGFNRLKYTTDWMAANNQKAHVGELGMPLDDPRWVTLFKGATDLAWSKGMEVYGWMAGDHWPIHGHPINYVPGFYQNKPVEPKVGGVMKNSMGLQLYTLFDSSQSYSNGAGVVTVTLFARGFVASPVTINLTRSAGTGTLSAASVQLPAGANPQVSFTYTAVANEKATITYSGPSQVPPARDIYSYTDPVTLASTNLVNAGRTLIAKYNCAEWLAANAMTDYVGANAGVAAPTGGFVRAIANSGVCDGPDNTFGMLNWHRTGTDFGTMTPPVLAVDGGARKRLDTVVATQNNWGSQMAQAVSPQLGNLNKVLNTYFAGWDESMDITQVPTHYNVVCVFHCKFAGPNLNTNNNGDGTLMFEFFSFITAAKVQTLRNRGQKVVLTVGGANNGYNISNRQQATNLVNSFVNISNQLGGVDGIAFNNFEANVGSSSVEMVWMGQELRRRFGQEFIITAPPDANSPADMAMLKTMWQNGVLSWAEPQFYDWVGYDDIAFVTGRLNAWRDNFGGDASRVVMGCTANKNLHAGMGVGDCVTTYNNFNAANPTFRGAMCWNAQIDNSSSTGTTSGNVWGLWCKRQDIKENVSGTPIQPNGKEKPLFDLHEAHFIVAAVENQVGTANGTIFGTAKVESDAYAELGMTSGSMPVARYRDLNGNFIDVRSPTGLGGGAHVLTAVSTGASQSLRVDKVQVATGARALAANGGAAANSHTLGWAFYNYAERNGTPGCFIYGVIAGKGSPTAAELTVLERYLGNTYAGTAL